MNPLFENEDYPSSRMEDLPSSGYGSNPNTIGKSQPAKIKVEMNISRYSSKKATFVREMILKNKYSHSVF